MALLQLHTINSLFSFKEGGGCTTRSCPSPRLRPSFSQPRFLLDRYPISASKPRLSEEEEEEETTGGAASSPSSSCPGQPRGARAGRGWGDAAGVDPQLTGSILCLPGKHGHRPCSPPGGCDSTAKKLTIINKISQGAARLIGQSRVLRLAVPSRAR